MRDWCPEVSLGCIYSTWKDNDKALSYTVLTTLATVPTLLFGSLHMTAFLELHKITTRQVASAHAVYVFWNTLNDVFAGYFADAYASRLGTRLGFVSGIQMIWVVVTVLPFLPLSNSSTDGVSGTLYYLLCIFLFDGCLSLIGVGRGALMAEITETESECVHLKRLSSIFGNAEVVVNLAGYALWSASKPGPFLSYICGMVLLSMLCNMGATLRLVRIMPRQPRAEAKPENIAPPLLTFLRSLPWNTWIYIAITALHELQGVAWGQFAIPLVEVLLASSSKFWRVVAIGSIGGIAGLITFLMTWVVDHCGLYSVMLWTFRCKVISVVFLGFCVYFLGYVDAVVFLLMLINEISMAMLSSFHLVILVNLLEEFAAQRREAGTSHLLAAYPNACGPALLVGVSALFVKPFNSVGPIVGTALFSEGKPDKNQLQDRALMLLSILPLTVGLLQWFLWSRCFTLYGRPSRDRVHET